MTNNHLENPWSKPASKRVEEFLKHATPSGKAQRQGRLIFSLDATASRKPMWDRAMALQSQMFEAAADIGTLSVSLVYYRGHDECKASKWTQDAKGLLRLMTTIDCRAGHTQLRKVLTRALQETERDHVAAVVFIGDTFEEERYITECVDTAKRLGENRTPLFIFHERDEHYPQHPQVVRYLTDIANLTGGSILPFDANSPLTLSELLKAVAAFAVGGEKALSAQQKELLQLEHRGD